VSEILQYQPPALLGLTSDELLRRRPAAASSVAHLQAALLPEVEPLLRTKTQRVCEYAAPCTRAVGTVTRSASATPTALAPSDVLAAVAALRRRRDAARAAAACADASVSEYWQLYGAVAQTLEVATVALRSHKHQSTYAFMRLSGRWLTKRCEALGLKLSVLQSQVLRDTYTPDTLAALRALRGHLVEAREQATAALHEATHRVEQYETVDGLRGLAHAYAQLQEQIRNKQWALSCIATSEQDAQQQQQHQQHKD
jgi:hypothetical protein